MDDREFGKIIDTAVEELPNDLQEKLDNVAIVISDWANRTQMEVLARRGEKGWILGLYEGVPQTRRGSHYGIGPTLPDKITIFKYPILRLSRSYDEAVRNIKNTVIHEIAHHFGMDDAAIHKAMKK